MLVKSKTLDRPPSKESWDTQSKSDSFNFSQCVSDFHVDSIKSRVHKWKTLKVSINRAAHWLVLKLLCKRTVILTLGLRSPVERPLSVARKVPNEERDPEEMACRVHQAIQGENDPARSPEPFGRSTVRLLLFSLNILMTHASTYPKIFCFVINSCFSVFIFIKLGFWFSCLTFPTQRLTLNFCLLWIQGRGNQMMNGSLHHNSQDKGHNNVSLAMQRITLMIPRYTYRTVLPNTKTTYIKSDF